MQRKTFLEIDLDKLDYNTNLFISHTKKKLIAVVKANAYGGVDYKIAKHLESKGVDFFAVSSIEEALKLRKNDIKSNILIMGYVHDLNIVRENDLSIIIPEADFVDENIDNLHDVKVHIKVNTGLNRLGIFPKEAKDVLNKLLKANAKVEGLMTHMACGDNEAYTKEQYELFKKVHDSLNYKFKYVHTSATDAAIYLNDEVSNYIRIGLGLYGYANIDTDFPLKSALNLKAEVIYCKQVKKDEGVSYGHKYHSDGTGYILTVAIGYADGIDRSLSGKKVWVENEEAEFVGTICMDLSMVHSANPHPVGSLVSVYDDHHNIKQRAIELDSCCCKIICDIQDRVERIYLQNGKIVDSINPRND